MHAIICQKSSSMLTFGMETTVTAILLIFHCKLQNQKKRSNDWKSRKSVSARSSWEISLYWSNKSCRESKCWFGRAIKLTDGWREPFSKNWKCSAKRFSPNCCLTDHYSFSITEVRHHIFIVIEQIGVHLLLKDWRHQKANGALTLFLNSPEWTLYLLD